MMALPDEKKQSYIFFVTALRAAMVHVAFVLVALVSFAFGHVQSATWGFLVLISGTTVVLMDLVRRTRFILSLTVLAIVVLITAINIA